MKKQTMPLKQTQHLTIKLHCSHLIASNKPWLDWASFFIFFVIFWLLCTELRTIPSLSVQLKAATLNQGIRMCPTSIYTCLFDPLQLHNWFVAYKMIRKKCFPSNVKLLCNKKLYQSCDKHDFIDWEIIII